MKISVITVCYNSEKTIKKSIESVLSQKNVDLDYIIIDGASTDNTLNIIREYSDNNTNMIRYVSEKDNGIYDAMNKGILLARGDIIGILNSDDFYASNDILSSVINEFEKNNIDCLYGNLMYLKKNKPFRYWISGQFNTFKYGWMPPHPTFFIKKSIYDTLGLYRLDCGTAADYELMLRFLEKEKIKSTWIDKLFIYMTTGGASNQNYIVRFKANKNDMYAWKINQLNRPLYTGYLKVLRKFPQFLYAFIYRLQTKYQNSRSNL